MDLKALQREAHAIAKEHGWWDEKRSFGDLIALVHSELSEALEAYREYGNTTHAWMELVDEDSDDRIPVGVGHELADVVIRVADMAEAHSGTLNADIPFTVDPWAKDASFGDWITMLHGILTDVLWHWYDEKFIGVIPDRHWIGDASSFVRGVYGMADHYGIDLDAAIEAKMEYNRGRPYRHGGKAL